MFALSSELHQTALNAIDPYARNQIYEVACKIQEILYTTASRGEFVTHVRVTSKPGKQTSPKFFVIDDIPLRTQKLINVMLKPQLIAAGYHVNLEESTEDDLSVTRCSTTLTISILE
jgi:flagellar assembly factor FliW